MSMAGRDEGELLQGPIIARAIEAADWSNAPIGNKAILKTACAALRATRPTPSEDNIGDEEWHLHREAGRIYRKCAIDLDAALSPENAKGREVGTLTADAIRELVNAADDHNYSDAAIGAGFRARMGIFRPLALSSADRGRE